MAPKQSKKGGLLQLVNKGIAAEKEQKSPKKSMKVQKLQKVEKVPKVHKLKVKKVQKVQKVQKVEKTILKRNPNAPKMPTGGAYGVFMNEQREDIKKTLEQKGENGIVAIAKETTARWKAMDEAQQKVFQDKFALKSEAYKKEVEDFKAAGGQTRQAVTVMVKESQLKKKLKMKRNPEAPKLLGGGAYSVFLDENRIGIKQDLFKRGEKGVAAIAKEAGARWKALGEEEKKVYQDTYAAKAETYKKELQEFKEAGGQTRCPDLRVPKMKKPSLKKKEFWMDKRKREDDAARAAVERMRASRASLVGA